QRRSGGYTTCGSTRMAGMPARPSMAAAADPARPPPTIAMSVYFIRFASLGHYHCAGKSKQILKQSRRFRAEVRADLTETQCRLDQDRPVGTARAPFDDFGKHLFTNDGNRRGVGRPRKTGLAQ